MIESYFTHLSDFIDVIFVLEEFEKHYNMLKILLKIVEESKKGNKNTFNLTIQD